MKRFLLTTVAVFAVAAPALAQTPPTPVEPAPEAAATPDAATADEKPKWDVQNPPGPSREIPIDVT
ncbi:MAG: hypothetical protein DCF28_13190, partial [Alphaproteobacteria bacterium]